MVTDTGVHTAPGKHHEAVTELRFAYKKTTPGEEAVTHQEYKYERTVADFKTQYFFAKFTQTKTRTWIKEIPAQKAVYEKFTWSGPYAPTVAPPSNGWKSAGTTSDTKGSKPDVIQHQGNGNGSYFYFKTTKAAVPAVPGHWSDWSAYGPWTLWQPVQHTSWQDSNAPIGSPEFHGQGDTWYRVWQQRPTGETRQVQTGTHVETSDWLTAPPAGEGWKQIDSRTVTDREATEGKTYYFMPGGPPSENLSDANYTTETPGEPWVKVDEKRFQTQAEYTEPDVVTNYSHTYKSPDCTVPPTPANPQASIEAICGAADITLTNPVTGEGDQITASFVVYVDGKFHAAYAVEGGKSETTRLTFDEDSGEHKIEVYQAGTSEYKLIAEGTVPSDCIAPEPETKVEFSDWVDGEFDCDATEVPQTRTKSVTEYVLVGNEWVAQEPVVTTEEGSRPLTDEEQEAADIECAGPQPENKVEESDWVTGKFECGDTTVQITREVTVTEYVREGAEWVEGESVTTTQTETRDLTAEEIASLECPVVVPPTEEPPVVTPSVDTPKTPTPAPAPQKSGEDETGTLATTGGDAAPLLTVAGIAALLTAAGAVLLIRRRKVASE
ncbi:membrane protein [Microbacterium phage Pumpernickel]|uniref:Membrane protein n=1 Tax=Microbacterium phage Pumpernickel TaxID=2885983 RepID=A0AAE9C2K2_9CAUD|nr:membrane protein [Microbacterium phage Pumpernickel]UDL15993.1 membrane protein [Microbacterium phage Pumpernickel]